MFRKISTYVNAQFNIRCFLRKRMFKNINRFRTVSDISRVRVAFTSSSGIHKLIVFSFTFLIASTSFYGFEE